MLTSSLTELIDFIYAGIDSIPPPPADFFLNRTILAPHNVNVSDTKDIVLEWMSGQTETFISADKVIDEGHTVPEQNQIPIPVEFLQTINTASLPPSELMLKIGCPLILLHNLAPSRGLCNGTRMILRRMSGCVLEVQLIGGDHDGEIAFIPRISLTPTDTGEIAFRFSRRQFPVRLAFAMTINKAQGQSVKYVGLDLRVPVFGHGQLYVALSRTTSGQRVKVLLSEPDALKTTNVVYTDVLLSPTA